MSIYNNNTLTINNQITTNGDYQIGRSISDQLTFSLDWTKKKRMDLDDPIVNGFDTKKDKNTKDRVIDYISMPDQIEFITSSLDAFEIWIYNESNRKLFFKNDKLYHIQNIED